MSAHRSWRAAPHLLMVAISIAACDPAPSDTRATLRLVETMAGLGSPESVDVLPGRVAPDAGELPDLPSGDRVVGSVTDSTGTRIFLSSALPMDSVGSVYGRRLASGGFRYEAPPGGLQTSGWVRESLCHPEGRRLSLTYGHRPGGSVDVELHVSPAEPDSCTADLDAVMGHSSVPRLHPPEGIDLGEPCRSGDGWRGRASPGMADDGRAMEHYRRWMESTPWRPAETPTPSTARSWTRVDEAGRPIRVTLAVTDGAGSPDCRTLTFNAGLHR